MNFLKLQLKFLPKKKIFLILFSLVVMVIFLGFATNFSFAQETLPEAYDKADFGRLSSEIGWFAAIIGSFLLWIVGLLAGILLWLMDLVVSIFQYNDFIHAQAVEIGWPLVRDLCNMFFVVIILVIAFSTILRISTYHYRSTLLKLVIMAILINFSKTILGFVIDFAQVIMLTFVNGFREAALLNLEKSFGISSWLSIGEVAPNKGLSWAAVIGALLLSVILAVVAIFTMLVYLVLLLQRIITLWILVIISPIAFLGTAFPALAKFTSQFWQRFWQMITLGITMAFFMWLSLTVLSMAGSSNRNLADEFEASKRYEQISGAKPTYQITASKVSDSEQMFVFVVAIALLLLGLQFAGEASGVAGKFAGAVSGKLSSFGAKAAKLPFKGAWGLAKEGTDLLYEKTGWMDLNMKRNWEKFQTVMGGRKGKQLQKGLQKSIERAREGGFISSRLAALTGGVGDHFDNYGWWKGIGRLTRPGLMGRRAKERGEEKEKEAEKPAEEATTLSKLAKYGGVNESYLAKGMEDIATHRAWLEKEREKIESEGGDTTEIENSLRQLENEGYILQAHLVLKDVDLNEATSEEVYNKLEEEKSKIETEYKDNNSTIKRIDEQIKELEEKKKEKEEKGQEWKAIEQEKLENFQSKRLELTQRQDTLNRTKIGIGTLGNDPEKIKEALDKKASKHGDENIRRVSARRKALQKAIDEKKIDPSSVGRAKKQLVDMDAELVFLNEQRKLKRYVSKDQKDEWSEQAEEKDKKARRLRGKAAKIRPVVGFEAQRARRALEAEELKKIADVEEQSEQNSLLEEAIARKDKPRIAAIMKKMAATSNDNEFLNHFGYDSGFNGFKEFFEKEIKDRAGFSEQEMLATANDIAYINESVKHWNTARMCAMDKGKWRWHTEPEHVMNAGTETSKLTERQVVTFNRLGFGGEDPRTGKYKMDGLGKFMVRTHGSAWLDNPRLILEQANSSMVQKLLESEHNYGQLTQALAGMMYKVKKNSEFAGHKEGETVKMIDAITHLFNQRMTSLAKKSTSEITEEVMENMGRES
ncbi:hypothetical protein KKF32_02000 [Patescibacteria group bacterium]|nr:hypothetical protein [Patescibacteria group bacterium]